MAGEPLKRTGYNAETPKHYLLDAGAVYRNLTYTSVGGWIGELLGATADGSTLTIEPEYREIEVDGPKVATRGGRALERASATLEVNVKEITAENYRLSLNGTIRDATEDEAPTGYKVIESKITIDDEDYDDNIAFVGTISGSDEPFIAILENTFVVSSTETEHTDDGEAVLTMEFQASATAEDVAANRLPWKILFPKQRV